MTNHGSFNTTHPLLEWQSEGLWLYTPRLVDPMRFTTPDGVVIEPGPFLTDLGSIPNTPLLRWILPPDEFAPAYILHDWGYKIRVAEGLERSRAWWDGVLYHSIHAMLPESIEVKIEAPIIYSAVRIGGWQAWHRRGNGGVNKCKLAT